MKNCPSKLRHADSILYFNLANIILLRSAVTIQKEVDPSAANCPLMATHCKICLDAARDMIIHIHRSFEVAPGLRRWSYYTFYCLHAILVLLPRTDDHNAADDLMCMRAVEVFEQIRLKASQRCAEVVRQYLRRRTKSRAKRQKHGDVNHRAVDAGEDTHDTFADPTLAQQQTGMAHFNAGRMQENSHDMGRALGLDNSISWPSISPTALQSEMYGALYSVDPTDDFCLGHQPYFFGAAGFSTELSADTTDWSQLWNG